jgi:hypothetical protein
MRIINTAPFNFINDRNGTTYRGYIKLNATEFYLVINKIINDKDVEEFKVLGSGKYPYLSKRDINQRLEKTELKCRNCRQFSLGNAFNKYVYSMFKNESRYYFKDHNYIIQVTN